MGDYIRSSRACRLEDLDGDLAAALAAHLEAHGLGGLRQEVVSCLEITSERVRNGLFATPGGKRVRVGLLLTPRFLLQVMKSDDDAPLARTVRLTDITVSDYQGTPSFARLPDTGVEVTGDTFSTFIGLSKDDAAETFKQVLFQAAAAARSSAPRP